MCLPPIKRLGSNYSLHNVSYYTVHSFIVPYIWLRTGHRVREQMQSQDSFIPPSHWEIGTWRVARLMYLTQWKPRAEPMKTSFKGGLKPAWFMASLLEGVQYLDRRRGIDNGSFNSPSPHTEQWSPAPETPHATASSTVGSRAAGALLLHFGEWRFPAHGYIISNGDSDCKVEEAGADVGK